MKPRFTLPRCRTPIAFTCLMLAVVGCSRGPGQQMGVEHASLTRPEAIARARVTTGRVVCRLENVNGNSIRASHTFPNGSRATLVGWSTVADRQQPVPPLAYIVFRSTVPDGSPDLFWPAKRVARPDLSPSDPRLAQAGYAGSDELPKTPGKYKVLLWVGDEHIQRECDTGEIFDLHP